MVGATYTAVYEFGPQKIEGSSLIHFGQSGDPKSKHYFDQAPLLSETRLKKIAFSPREVRENTVLSYHPGQERAAAKIRAN